MLGRKLFAMFTRWILSSAASSALLPATALLVLLVSPGMADAQTYTVLHSFGNGTDGAVPMGLSAAHNGGIPDGYWGATLYGGTSGGLGTVFRFYKSGTTLDYAVVHNFTGPDGAYPRAAPVGSSVFAVGTTVDGGNSIDDTTFGTAYEVTYRNSEFSFTTIYKFCDIVLCDDGSNPEYGLDNVNYSYGTTALGGANNMGAIFQVNRTAGAEAVLYNFTPNVVNGTTYNPYPSGLYRTGEDTPLYGTTWFGGSSAYGTVFSFNPSTITYSTLHTFTGTPDGKYPSSGVVVTDLGPLNIYGTTMDGGEYGYGTIFEIDSSGNYSILYNFTGGADGVTPSGLVWVAGEDGEEILYGISAAYGGGAGGTVFEFTSNGGFSVLHSFCQQTGCSDGGTPTGIIYDSGAIYGTTGGGGAYGQGVAFELQF